MSDPAETLVNLADFRRDSGAASGVKEPGCRQAMDSAEALPSLPSGTVTFLLTDIERSTQAWDTEPSSMTAAVSRHYEILDAAVTRHGGVRPVEQGEGDSVVAAFFRPSDAIAAALDAQFALLSEDWPQGAHLAVRMALHTGEAQLRGDDNYAGTAIIRCARLRGLAYGGQVLLSASTAELLGDQLADDVALVDLGDYQLRGLSRPERVFQLRHPGLPARFPPLRSLAVLRNNLPAQLSTFVGRQAELADLHSLVAATRLVSLVGAGGCGKTRLAAELGQQLAQAYPDGVWWIDLAPLTDPGSVPRAAMAAVGLRDMRGLEPLERFTDHLGERRVLLVLDNCEHVLESVTGLLDVVLRACPKVTAMATSREPLGLPGEVVWRVPPLSLPQPGEAPAAGRLDTYDAVRLFIERAVEARPSFRVDNHNAPVVADICARLDGIPLAIELAAARVRTLSPDHILGALADRFRLLTGGARTVMARQQTLQASVEWSHDLLTDAERILLRRLAAFSGGFGLEAAQDVCAAKPLDGSDVLQLLSLLVDKSLVVFDEDDGRYRLLQTIYSFATERLLASGELASIRDGHCAYYLATAESAAALLEAAPQPEVLAALESDHDNLRAALEWALATANDDAALRLVVALTLFWAIHGHYSDAQAWYRRVLGSNATDDLSPLRGRALWGLSHLSLLGMDVGSGYGAAEAEQAAMIARHLGDSALLARALGGQGLLQLFVFPDAAYATLEHAIEAAREAGDEWALASALHGLVGYWLFDRDRVDLAAPALEELVDIAARAQNPYWRAWLSFDAGIAAFRQGRLAEAREALEAALASALDLADPQLETFAVVTLADVQIAQGAYEEVASLLARTAERQSRSARGRQEMVELRIGVAAFVRGDLATARERLDAISAVVREIGMPVFVAQLAGLSGRVALAADDTVAARSAFEEASAIAEHIGSPWERAAADNNLGRLAHAEGELAAAEDFHHRALAIAVQHGLAGVVVETLETLASLAAAGESHAEATRLLGAAEALREAKGHQRSPLDQACCDADLAQFRADLGDEAVGRAWSEGTALSLEEAVAYASRARGERKRPPTGWAALTPTEVEVVALAAQGHTNAEIGRQLFISAGTAKVHLSHVYTKLGIGNRTELAARATVRGLGLQ